MRPVKSSSIRMVHLTPSKALGEYLSMSKSGVFPNKHNEYLRYSQVT